MILKNISIINFKNIKSANLELSPKINCLIGHNGMGKTNFLDAIYYLSFCRSAYNSIDSQIITHDEPFFMLEGNYDNDKGEIENVYCGMKRGTKKHFKRNKKEASDLKKKYFGAEGDLYKMREALMGPIQEEIYTAVKEISDLRGYSLVLDRASNSGIIFGSPKIDISNEVLQKLGYSK